MKSLRRCFLWLVCLFGVGGGQLARGYSVMTHEQLIDLTWDASIVPLLRSRYPSLTPEQLEQARAYAYGGCVIQDIGYYPFGDAFFSNLTHYVRSGDFVVNLFRNAQNANELAFAIGALSHYIGDNVGHATATNRAVPVEFHKLQERYGNTVNYVQGEHQHVRVEFAFDINEVAHHRLAPQSYLRHVGLEVSTRQLSLAYYQTYGIRADFTVKRTHRINVRGYRFSVRSFIPRIAYAVTLLHRGKLPQEMPSDDVRKLDAEIATVAAQNHWDDYRQKPGIGTYSLAGLLWILPKVGPISLVAVKGPTTDTEAEYIHSVLVSTDRLNAALRRFTPPPATVVPVATLPPATTGKLDAELTGEIVPALANVASSTTTRAPDDLLPAGTLANGTSLAIEQRGTRTPPDPRHPLANRDLDTGVVVRPSGYPLTDQTFCKLAHTLAAQPGLAIPPGIKRDILAYYSNMNLPFDTRKHPDQWKQLQADLTTLSAMSTSSEPTPYPTFGEGDDDEPDVAGGSK
ncbi:zinc dependent phospholipase C family protein [Terriglobus sp. RCC_193]|uniref:zinc dependent phospholipase C family protein n=1 Tax=Terriglobus sp. RCC_193 TaxID=3239218 RepID=UPI0035246F76